MSNERFYVCCQPDGPNGRLYYFGGEHSDNIRLWTKRTERAMAFLAEQDALKCRAVYLQNRADVFVIKITV